MADTNLDFLVLDSPAWEDLRVPMTATKLGGSKDPGFTKLKDDGAGSQGVFGYVFDKATEEELYFAVQLPHSWAGTDIEPHVHWVPTTAGEGVVRWGLEYTWAAIGGTFGATALLHVNSTAAGSLKHTVADLGSIVPPAATVSSMILCRVFRAAAHTDDTYDADAALLEVDFHYRLDTLGSRLEMSK